MGVCATARVRCGVRDTRARRAYLLPASRRGAACLAIRRLRERCSGSEHCRGAAAASLARTDKKARRDPTRRDRTLLTRSRAWAIEGLSSCSARTTRVQRDTRPDGTHGNDAGLRSRAAKRPLLVLQPSKGWVSLDLPVSGSIASLLWFLTCARDAALQADLLGVLWAIIQPVAPMLTLSWCFPACWRPADGPTRSSPSPVCLPWTFFANAVTNARTAS